MATKTSKYEFNKPEQNDFYDVDVQNENWDKLDKELSEFDDSGATEDIKSFPDFLSKFVTGNKVAITLRNLKAGLQFVLHAGQIVNNCVTDNTGLLLSAAQGKVLKDLIDTTNNNLSKRFATAASGNTYNSVSDFPTTGSGFGVNTQALTLYAGFVIPEYSRICFMNYGGSPDAAISAVSQSGEIYSAFRSSGTWQNGKVSASKDDLTNIIVVKSFQGTSITIAGNASEKVSIPISTPTGYKVVGKISERWNGGPEMYLSQVDLTPTTFTGYAANLRNSEATSIPTISVLFVKS